MVSGELSVSMILFLSLSLPPTSHILDGGTNIWNNEFGIHCYRTFI